MLRNTPKVIRNLQLHISHQTRSYFSAKIIRGLSYTCFLGTWVLIRAIWGKKAQIPLRYVQGYMKSNSKPSAPYLTSNETLL